MSVDDMVVDILKQRMEWMGSSRLVREVMKRRGVSARQAYRDLEEALEDGKIRKTKRGSDVVYGLPNWALPDTSPTRQEEALPFQDTFKHRCFKTIDRIREQNSEGHGKEAMFEIVSLVATLPPSMKTKLDPMVNKAVKSFRKNYPKYERGLIRRKVTAPEVDFLIGEISTLLHENL